MVEAAVEQVLADGGHERVDQQMPPLDPDGQRSRGQRDAVGESRHGEPTPQCGADACQSRLDGQPGVEDDRGDEHVRLYDLLEQIRNVDESTEETAERLPTGLAAENDLREPDSDDTRRYGAGDDVEPVYLRGPVGRPGGHPGEVPREQLVEAKRDGEQDTDLAETRPVEQRRTPGLGCHRRSLDGDALERPEFALQWPDQRRADAGVVLRVEHHPLDVVTAGFLDEQSRRICRAEHVLLGPEVGRLDCQVTLAGVLAGPDGHAVEEVLGLLVAGILR